MSILTEHDVARGLLNSEFFLYYQPKASLITNCIVGAEALARWRLPDGTVLPPAAFIPLAERGTMISALTLQLWLKLAHDLVDKAMDSGIRVSFNVTAQDFEDSTLTDTILHALSSGQLQPDSLELEITETQALQAGEHVLCQVQALTEAGIGLAMDDYGIGYSSMDTLSQWPFTTIKLDQGIVGRMLASSKNATIVRSSIRMGHELGLNVVAEGVESIEQHDFLVEAGCKLVQGYLVSPPLPLEEFESFRKSIGTPHGMPIGLVHMAIIDHPMAAPDGELCDPAHGASARFPCAHHARPSATVHHPLRARAVVLRGRLLFRAYSDVPRPRHAPPSPPCGRRTDRRPGSQRGNAADIGPLLYELKQASTALVRLLEDIEDAGLASLYGAAGQPGEAGAPAPC